MNSSKTTHGSASNLQMLDSGANDTLEYRIQAVKKDGAKPISLWHDVSLVHINPETNKPTPYLNFVCAIPKFSRKKFEIATDEVGYPIKQYEKKGQLREVCMICTYVGLKCTSKVFYLFPIKCIINCFLFFLFHNISRKVIYFSIMVAFLALGKIPLLFIRMPMVAVGIMTLLMSVILAYELLTQMYVIHARGRGRLEDSLDTIYVPYSTMYARQRNL